MGNSDHGQRGKRAVGHRVQTQVLKDLMSHSQSNVLRRRTYNDNGKLARAFFAVATSSWFASTSVWQRISPHPHELTDLMSNDRLRCRLLSWCVSCRKTPFRGEKVGARLRRGPDPSGDTIASKARAPFFKEDVGWRYAALMGLCSYWLLAKRIGAFHDTKTCGHWA